MEGKAWGQTAHVWGGHGAAVHYIKAKKGGYCSKHCHRYKSNRFYIISGCLQIEVWQPSGIVDVTVLKPHQSCNVPPGVYHRFKALEDTDAIEVYWVELLESDIVRETVGGVETDANIGSP